MQVLFEVPTLGVLIRVTVRFFSGHPLPHLLGVCRPDLSVLPPRQPPQTAEMPGLEVCDGCGISEVNEMAEQNIVGSVIDSFRWDELLAVVKTLQGRN